MSPQQLQQKIIAWIQQHYPDIELPQGDVPLGRDGLLRYYQHMEIAMLELQLHDDYPGYLAMIRQRCRYLKRLQGAEFAREQFRSLSAF